MQRNLALPGMNAAEILRQHYISIGKTKPWACMANRKKEYSTFKERFYIAFE